MSDPLLQLRRADDRFRSTAAGIETAHVFSFGAHYDPEHVGHGPLVVLNEESLLAGRGFDDHPHADAEILTWVAEGSLVHADSTGHRGVVVPGLAQRLSAGSGIVGATWGRAAALTEAFLADGRSGPLGEGALGWGEVNALMPVVE